MTRLISPGFALMLLLPLPVAADDGLVGQWQLRVEGRRGVQEPVLTVVQNDGRLSGHLAGPRGEMQIDEITTEDDAFSFPLEISTPFGAIELRYNGRRSGDELAGTVDTPRGESPFSGKRQ